MRSYVLTIPIYIVTIYIATMLVKFLNFAAKHAIEQHHKGRCKMLKCNFLRNAVAVACLMVIAYLSFSLFSGRLIDTESLQGTWSSVCGQYELTVNGASFSNQSGETGEFRLRGNSITFEGSDVNHRLRVSQEYVIIGNIVFIRAQK